jgi:hypothetical protein
MSKVCVSTDKLACRQQRTLASPLPKPLDARSESVMQKAPALSTAWMMPGYRDIMTSICGDCCGYLHSSYWLFMVGFACDDLGYLDQILRQTSNTGGHNPKALVQAHSWQGYMTRRSRVYAQHVAIFYSFYEIGSVKSAMPSYPLKASRLNPSNASSSGTHKPTPRSAQQPRQSPS